MDYPRDRFVRTPISVIGTLLSYLENEEQRKANIATSAVGKLGVQIAYIAWGMGGGKGAKPKISLNDFLPFPEWKPFTPTPESGPTSHTKVVLADLLKERRIPPHVYTQLSSPPERGT